MPTYCKSVSLAFQGCQGRRVTAAFDGGSITSNAGALLLRRRTAPPGSSTGSPQASRTTAIPV